MSLRGAAAVLLAACLLVGAAGAPAQDLLNSSPRGLVDITTPPALRAAPAPAAVASSPGATVRALPPDPAHALKPIMFGSQIFSGRFGSEAFSGFNPAYQIAVGDRISVRMWGAFNYDAVQTVDAQGNLFIPNVGPIRVLGVRNADLNQQVASQVKRTFRDNVGVYATLEGAQPVKVYVTGFVKAPGLYGGLSSDSVLYYLDRAGGIDPDRGSYLEVDVLRGGQPRAKVNLYRFLLAGQIEPLQLQDGDTIVVAPRKHTAAAAGGHAHEHRAPVGRATAQRVPPNRECGAGHDRGRRRGHAHVRQVPGHHPRAHRRRPPGRTHAGVALRGQIVRRHAAPEARGAEQCGGGAAVSQERVGAAKGTHRNLAAQPGDLCAHRAQRHQ